MNQQIRKITRKIAMVSYTIGVLSLVAGMILSVAVQPVSASNQATGGGGNHKVWICHVPPGNPGNAHAIYVDKNGWNGHDIHPLDFLLTGKRDPRCGSTPTDVPPTEVPPTDVPPTDVPPTDVPPTDVPPTDVPPTDVPPTDVPPTNTPEETSTPENTSTPEATPTSTLTPEITLQTTQEPTSTATPTQEDTKEPTSTIVPTETSTPTEVETPTETPTETLTPTELPTRTMTPTIEVRFIGLKLSWVCIQGSQVWTVTNENDFPVGFEWELNDGGTASTGSVKLASLKARTVAALANGSATVPANSQYSWAVSGGYHTMQIFWEDSNGNVHSLSVTTSENSPCFVEENTPTPDSEPSVTPDPEDPTSTPDVNRPTNTPLPQRTNTVQVFVPQVVTLTPDPVDPQTTQAVLIPVTGGDFNNPFSGNPLSTLFVNFGIVMLGIALTSHGVSLSKKD